AIVIAVRVDHHDCAERALEYLRDFRPVHAVRNCEEERNFAGGLYEYAALARDGPRGGDSASEPHTAAAYSDDNDDAGVVHDPDRARPGAGCRRTGFDGEGDYWR